MMMYLAGNFQFDFHTCFLSENEIEFFNSLMETKKKHHQDSSIFKYALFQKLGVKL